MLKKRLIFTLLLQDGIFQLSRNFSLQAVGNLDWLYKYYHLGSITRSIDELVLLNVERNGKDTGNFAKYVHELSRNCFIPIAAGGGINSIDDAYLILRSGADKLILNSPVVSNPSLIRDLVRVFGSQCIVASIDYKNINNKTDVFISNGVKPTGMTLVEAIKGVENLHVGELYITCIDRDGTGQGYDLENLTLAAQMCRLPIIASGGVGDFRHLLEGIKLENVTGVSTANIFNFMGQGLTEARTYIEQSGIALAKWEFSSLQAHSAGKERHSV